MPEPDDDDAALIAAEADLPPAGDLQGDHGHDTATVYARGARLLRLRTMRLTYAQIAESEGYADPASARNALIRALDRHEVENAGELRQIENMALDSDERVLRGVISDPAQPLTARLRAIDTRTRLSARRSRLNGLDAPVQVAISAGVQADLHDALAELDSVVAPLLAAVPDLPKAIEA